MARKPERLDAFYDRLKEVHKSEMFCDWRFGQFMSNFLGWTAGKYNVDIFFPEEDKMLEYLDEYVKFCKGENRA